MSDVDFVFVKMEVVDYLRPPWLKKEEEIYFPISKIYDEKQKGEILATFLIEDKSYSAIVRNKECIHFNFEYRETVQDILLEKYCYLNRNIINFLPFHYRRLPFSVREIFVNYLIKKKFKNRKNFPKFPMEKSLISLEYVIDKLFNNKFFLKWPNNKKYCVLLTHDIDTQNGFKKVKEIQKIEEGYEFKSSWNVVGNLYRMDYSTLEFLLSKGCEIGFHSNNHDNKVAYQSEAIIRKGIIECMELINRYNIKGFRSPSYLRSPTLFKVLQDYFLYDSSIPDVDFFSPSSLYGCCSIFPYMIGNLVELPVTIPYEIPLFIGYNASQLNDFWKPKIDWIKEVGGMILINTHPDNHLSGSLQMMRCYERLLTCIKEDSEGFTARPFEVVGLLERTSL